MSTKTNVFLAVSVPVFFLVIMTAAVVTFIMPEVYSSKARIRVQNDAAFTASQGAASTIAAAHDPTYIQTELAVIKSELVLDPVVELLDLNARWGHKFHMEGKLMTAESRAILRGRLELRPVPNASLIDITACSDDNQESAEIANAVAQVYRDYRRNRRLELMQNIADKANETAQMSKISQQDSAAANVPLVEILDHAMPGPKPIRPNVTLNLFLGVVIGIVLSLLVGGLVAFLVGKFLPAKPAMV